MCSFPRLRPGGVTVDSVLPPFRLSFRVPLVSTFRFRAFAAHPCLGTISFRVSVYFSFGWSSQPMDGPGKGSAIIYDYFFESVYAGRLCKTQRGPSLA